MSYLGVDWEAGHDPAPPGWNASALPAVYTLASCGQVTFGPPDAPRTRPRAAWTPHEDSTTGKSLATPPSRLNSAAFHGSMVCAEGITWLLVYHVVMYW